MPTSRKRTLMLAVPTALAALVLVACGDDSSSTSDDSGSTTSSTAASTTASSPPSRTTDGVVDLAANDALGGQEILTDSKGFSLYLFEQDTSGDASTCDDECAQAWPPLTTKGAVKAGDGVDGDLLSTFKRDDGSTQVAYNGHPLYYYAEDTAAGDANGNDVDEFGAEWYAMNADGDSIGDADEAGDDDSASEDSGSDSTSDDDSGDESTSTSEDSGGAAAGGY